MTNRAKAVWVAAVVLLGGAWAAAADPELDKEGRDLTEQMNALKKQWGELNKEGARLAGEEGRLAQQAEKINRDGNRLEALDRQLESEKQSLLSRAAELKKAKAGLDADTAKIYQEGEKISSRERRLVQEHDQIAAEAARLDHTNARAVDSHNRNRVKPHNGRVDALERDRNDFYNRGMEVHRRLGEWNKAADDLKRLQQALNARLRDLQLASRDHRYAVEAHERQADAWKSSYDRFQVVVRDHAAAAAGLKTRIDHYNAKKGPYEPKITYDDSIPKVGLQAK
jgi:chromosome segregation ATPase